MGFKDFFFREEPNISAPQMFICILVVIFFVCVAVIWFKPSIIPGWFQGDTIIEESHSTPAWDMRNGEFKR